MRLPWMPNRRSRRTTNLNAHWYYSPATRGPGTVLVSSHDGGLQVIAPPGVALANEARAGQPFSHEGWRWAFWPRDVNGEVWLDIQRPTKARIVTLEEVVQLLPPARWKWVYERCRRYLLSLVGYVTPSASGIVPMDAEDARARMTALVDELQSVFPNEEWAALIPTLSDILDVPDSLDLEAPTASPDRRVSLLNVDSSPLGEHVEH